MAGNIIDQRQRWRWWYESISDWMIANPGQRLIDCASALNKSPNYIYMIVNSDLFKEFHAQRRAEWRERHDEAIVAKTTQIAERGLDMILERMEKKRDAIPLSMVKEVTDSALSRLGYGTPSPTASTQVNVQTGPTTVVQVSAQDLAEARALVRSQQEARLLEAPPSVPALRPDTVIDASSDKGAETERDANAPVS